VNANADSVYRTNTLLFAIRVCPSSQSDKPGGITSLPAGAFIETLGPSNLCDGMIEVAWQGQRYAVFDRSLASRATLIRTKTVGQ
jgi:hypothetical protein